MTKDHSSRDGVTIEFDEVMSAISEVHDQIMLDIIRQKELGHHFYMPSAVAATSELAQLANRHTCGNKVTVEEVQAVSWLLTEDDVQYKTLVKIAESQRNSRQSSVACG
ncbi:MAG: hypothetical protein V1838_04450 [Patescibacteria group bacterium]